MNQSTQDFIDFAKDPTVILCALFFAMGFTIAAGGLPLGVPLALVLLPAFSQYLFVILERTALGHQKAPVMDTDALNPFQLRPFLALLLILFFIVAYTTANTLGYAVSGLVVLTAIIVLPAVLCMLAMSGTFTEALNPVNILQFVYRTKVAYIRAVAAMVLSGVIIVIVGSLGVSNFFLLAFALYVLLLVFRYLGQTIYVQRHDLGLVAVKGPDVDAARAAALELSERKRLMDQIFMYSNATHYDKAYLETMAYIHRTNEPEETLKWFIEHALLWDDKELGLRLAQWLVSEYLSKNDVANAWAVFEQAIMANSKFRTRDSKEAFALAQHARQMGKKPMALDVLGPYIDETKPRQLSTDALVLAVRIAAEGLNDLETAKRYIHVARKLGQIDPATQGYFDEVSNLSS